MDPWIKVVIDLVDIGVGEKAYKTCDKTCLSINGLRASVADNEDTELNSYLF